MNDVDALARAVEAVAAVEQGRLVVVGPAGVRGNPYDPDRLDSATVDGDVLVVSVGEGHARYLLTGATLVHADDGQVRLAGRRLTTTFLPYGNAGMARSTQWLRAEILFTHHPDVAQAAYRTRGTLEVAP